MVKNEVLDGVGLTDAGIASGFTMKEAAKASGVYQVKCIGPKEHLRSQYLALKSRLEELIAMGSEAVDLIRDQMEDMLEDKWADCVQNVVTTVGGNFALDTVLAGSAYTAAWYIGLISATGYTSIPVIDDTAASHSTWAEDSNYSQAARPTASWSAAASKSKSLSSALTYSINATTTIKGCFLINNSTKGGTTGTLYSAGLFTGGDKAVANGDTLSVSYTASV